MRAQARWSLEFGRLGSWSTPWCGRETRTTVTIGEGFANGNHGNDRSGECSQKSAAVHGHAVPLGPRCGGSSSHHRNRRPQDRTQCFEEDRGRCGAQPAGKACRVPGPAGWKTQARDTSALSYPSSTAFWTLSYVLGRVKSGGGGSRTHTLLPELDFESSASAGSATPPWVPKPPHIRPARAVKPRSRRPHRLPTRTLGH